MKPKKVTFDTLSKSIIKENQSYRLNAKGKAVLDDYYKLVKAISKSIIPVIRPYTTGVDISKEIALAVIATINNTQVGAGDFDIASRLDVMTSGNKHFIDGSKFTFNNKDKILQYIEVVK